MYACDACMWRQKRVFAVYIKIFSYLINLLTELDRLKPWIACAVHSGLWNEAQLTLQRQACNFPSGFFSDLSVPSALQQPQQPETRYDLHGLVADSQCTKLDRVGELHSAPQDSWLDYVEIKNRKRNWMEKGNWDRRKEKRMGKQTEEKDVTENLLIFWLWGLILVVHLISITLRPRFQKFQVIKNILLYIHRCCSRIYRRKWSTVASTVSGRA